MYSLTLYLSVFVMCYFKLLCFQINLSIFQTWILGFYAECLSECYAECLSECLSENLKINENFSGFRVNYKQ